MLTKRFSEYIKSQNNKIQLSIGEIDLIAIIGRGGNGIVYKCEMSGNTFAAKFLLSDSSGNTLQTKKKRFLAEYFNIMMLENSKGIVKYIDFDIISFVDEIGKIEIPVILMKLYNNSLSKFHIKDSKQVKDIFNFLLDVIQSIHNQGIIHRDIKPENILVIENNFSLADFGIACYNPEIFQLRAETEKKERIGNRLFSAPEQENAGITPHETMDIYALGQVMQWLVTNETHRGTNRQSITKTYEDLTTIDRVIEKCLSQNPSDRFQSIQEIRDHISKITKTRKDVWYYIHEFSDVLTRSFPKNEFGIVNTDNPKRIDRLFQNLKDSEEKFDTYLWFQDGIGNIDFKLTHKGERTWKLDDNEYTIKQIWVYYDSSCFNDFIIVNYEKGFPFIIDSKESYVTVIVDNKYHISYSEYQNGYAEIDDEIIKLKNHKTELIERQREEGYFAISTNFNCILLQENDKNVIDFFKQLKIVNGKLSLEDFKKFQWELRKHKHFDVFSSL